MVEIYCNRLLVLMGTTDADVNVTAVNGIDWKMDKQDFMRKKI